MFQFDQKSGKWSLDGVVWAAGYSGNGAGLNNPAAEDQHMVGVIPRGKWKIGKWYDDPHLGPCVMHLDPDGFDPHGRSLFRIHGDNAKMNHSASDGCIILPRDIRERIAYSGISEVEVV